MHPLQPIIPIRAELDEPGAALRRSGRRELRRQEKTDEEHSRE
jgi:hypothetical protein